MFKRGSIQRDSLQSGNRVGDRADRSAYLCHGRIFVRCHSSASVDRCLQYGDAFRRVLAFQVAFACGDHRVELILRYDLPQFMYGFGHRFVRCLQRICARVLVSQHVLRCRYGISQCLFLARTQSFYIVQDVFVDEVDRGLYVRSQRIYALFCVQVSDRLGQLQRSTDHLARCRIAAIIQQCLCFIDRCQHIGEFFLAVVISHGVGVVHQQLQCVH